MKIRFTVTAEVDPADWSDEYGIPVGEVPADIIESFRTATTADDTGSAPIVDAITAAWPALRSLGAVTVSTAVADDAPGAAGLTRDRLDAHLMTLTDIHELSRVQVDIADGQD